MQTKKIEKFLAREWAPEVVYRAERLAEQNQGRIKKLKIMVAFL